MVITKELKRVAKSADYFFLHVDNRQAKLELMKSRDLLGDHNPTHLATFDATDCSFDDFSQSVSTYYGKATIFISDYEAMTFLSLVKVLQIGSEVRFEIFASNNNQIMNDHNLVFDQIYVNVRKNKRDIGRFMIYAHPGENNLARAIRFN